VAASDCGYVSDEALQQLTGELVFVGYRRPAIASAHHRFNLAGQRAESQNHVSSLSHMSIEARGIPLRI
jgi:hypothetical protein